MEPVEEESSLEDVLSSIINKGKYQWFFLAVSMTIIFTVSVVGSFAPILLIFYENDSTVDVSQLAVRSIAYSSTIGSTIGCILFVARSYVAEHCIRLYVNPKWIFFLFFAQTCLLCWCLYLTLNSPLAWLIFGSVLALNGWLAAAAYAHFFIVFEERIVDEKKQEYMVVAMFIAWDSATAVAAAIAWATYSLRGSADMKSYLLWMFVFFAVLSVCYVLGAFYTRIDSFDYLILKKRNDKIVAILRTISKMNGIDVDDEDVSQKKQNLYGTGTGKNKNDDDENVKTKPLISVGTIENVNINNINTKHVAGTKSLNFDDLGNLGGLGSLGLNDSGMDGLPKMTLTRQTSLPILRKRHSIDQDFVKLPRRSSLRLDRKPLLEFKDLKDINLLDREDTNLAVKRRDSVDLKALPLTGTAGTGDATNASGEDEEIPENAVVKSARCGKIVITILFTLAMLSTDVIGAGIVFYQIKYFTQYFVGAGAAGDDNLHSVFFWTLIASVVDIPLPPIIGVYAIIKDISHVNVSLCGHVLKFVCLMLMYLLHLDYASLILICIVRILNNMSLDITERYLIAKYDDFGVTLLSFIETFYFFSSTLGVAIAIETSLVEGIIWYGVVCLVSISISVVLKIIIAKDCVNVGQTRSNTLSETIEMNAINCEVDV